MAGRIRKSGVASQNEIMSAVKSVSVIIPMIEDFAKRIAELEKEVITLKAAKVTKAVKVTKAKTKPVSEITETKTKTKTETKEND